MATKKRNRRTPEERIAALQAEIERVKSRAAQAKVKKDPALRHISGAVRAIDKAAAETKDTATRKALTEARATLAACLALNGSPAPGSTGRGKPRIGPPPEPDQVFAFLRKHPGSRSEQICDELGTNSVDLRPVLHLLRDEGKLKVEGKARATRYSVKK